MSNQNNSINQSLQGYYKVAIVNATTKEVVWEQPEFSKNLILNQGMDGLFDRSVVDSFTYAIAGDGSRINSKDSGLSTITQSANTIYLYNRTGQITDFTSSMDGGNYPSVLEAGDVIQYTNLSESKVVSVDAGGFMATVDTNYNFGAGDAQGFIVWKTSQTALQYELKRTNTYLTGSCGTTTIANQKIHRRVFDFSAETSLTSYNELGMGWASSGAGTTFSRMLFPSTVVVAAGYQLRVIYDLIVTYTPAISQSKNIGVGGGWGTLTGWEMLQNITNGTSIVSSNGASNNATAVLDPYWVNTGGNYLSVFVSSESSSLAPFGSAVDRQTADVGYSSTGFSRDAYVNGSYTCTKTGTIPINNGNSTHLRSIGLGTYGVGINPASSTYQVLCYVYDTDKTKTSSQSISFTFRWTWTRVLS